MASQRLITNKNTNWKDIGEYSTTTNNTIDFSTLELEEDEYVKEYRICFGKVKQGFTQVEAPKLFAKVNENVQNNRIGCRSGGVFGNGFGADGVF